jgi:ABC-2 type transport system permease protein
MLWFQVRVFAHVGYFIQLMVVSTLSAGLLQRLALGSGAMGADVWLRTAEIGLWTTCTASAGIIGFQRFQGTLAPLLIGRQSAAKTLSSVVAAGSTFGLLAFPLSAILIKLLGGPVWITWQTVLGTVLVWFGAMTVSFVVASIFVLTPNATTYEVVVLVPILLFSGIFGFPGWLPQSVASVLLVIPLTGSVQYLAASDDGIGAGFSSGLSLPSWVSGVVGFVCSIVWLILARYLLSRCLKRARVDGTLEVV